MVTIYKPKQKPQRLGQFIKVDIERVDYEGHGVGYYQGKIVFVSGALPGEQVVAKVSEEKPNFIKATTQQLVNRSGLRVEPFCPHYAACGGCQLQHVSSTEQAALKQKGVDELLKHQTGLATLPWQPLIRGSALGYRRKARIGVWYDKKSAKVLVGFRQAASKNITAVRECAVLSPVLTPVFAVLANVVATLPEPSCITHAEVIDADGHAFIVVRHTAPLTGGQRAAFIAAWPAATWLGESAPGEITYWQPDVTPPNYRLTTQALNLQFSPDDFIQVNANVNQQMVDQAIAWLAPTTTESILDLYAGMGNFSLALAQRAKRVHGVEGLPKMVQQANANATANHLQNVQFWQADLHLPWGSAQWNQPIYDKALLDPARSGAEGAVQQLVLLKPAQILYVSCNAATFARDSQVLLKAGYQLQKLAGMDMFPHTGHLELMALFSRHS